MAQFPQLKTTSDRQVVVRANTEDFEALRALLFRRYPEREWATFARCGWRATSKGLVLTVAAIYSPTPGDLDERVANVAITEQYSLRVALAAETHRLAVMLLHSHPLDSQPRPSPIDDDMDGYYADYFGTFAPARPYVSLIVSEIEGQIAVSGRVFWNQEWLVATHILVERTPIVSWPSGRPPRPTPARRRTARLNSAFGEEAAARMRRATVAVIGAGGTGSAAIEVMARAGIGRLIVVDPDHLDDSNLERVHGSYPAHAAQRVPKVQIARDHVYLVDPTVEVVPYVGSLPQPEIVDAVLTADVVLGCTDQHHSRLAISDLAFRYLVPAIDCGVALEGEEGAVTGQTVQLVRFLAADPCALCRRMIDTERVAQELMSHEERDQRRAAAAVARGRGEDGDRYWRDRPQLNTVGYLTTAAGALAAGFAIGWIAGRFDPPFTRLQMNLVQPLLDVTDVDDRPRPECTCRRARGWADQARADALLTPPSHWPPVRRL